MEHNFFQTKDQLCLLVKGPSPVVIITSALVTLTIGVPPMSVDDFFGEAIIANLAAFFGIPAEKIKVASASRESSRRRRSDSTQVACPFDLNGADNV